MGDYTKFAEALLSQSGPGVLRQCRKQTEPQWQPHRLVGSRQKSGSHRDTLRNFVKLKDEGIYVKLIKEFKARDPWQVEEAVARLKGQYHER